MRLPRNDTCPICQCPAFKDTDDVVPGYNCVRCGDYRIDGAQWNSGSLSEDQTVKLSGWVREQNRAQNTPHLTKDAFRLATSRAVPRLGDRAVQFLKVFARRYPNLGAWVSVDDLDDEDQEMLGVSFSKDLEDATVLLELLVAQGFLSSSRFGYGLTVGGILKLEEIQYSGAGSAIGFVAMSFDSSMNIAWSEGFEPAIRAAGFTALRISDKHYVGGITDQIMAEIRGARFVIADYTGQKAGVYFEAGFALGLGLVVIPTCHQDEIGHLHFDVKHLNTLVWREPADLADKLAKRIRAVVGEGPV